MPIARVSNLRAAMLRPLACQFEGPACTAFYLFEDGSWVVESFHDAPIEVMINGRPTQIEAHGWATTVALKASLAHGRVLRQILGDNIGLPTHSGGSALLFLGSDRHSHPSTI